MGFSSKSGRARTSTRNPRAFAVCDRCGIWYNHYKLSWQFDWAGTSLINKRILVCNTCKDVPQEQLRAIVLPADPVPIMNARTEPYITDESNFRQVSGYNSTDPRTGIPVPSGDIRVTTQNSQATSDRRVTQTIGAPLYSTAEYPGTDQNAVTYRIVTNASDNGAGNIRLSVDTTNGMITGQKIIVSDVEGTNEANGSWLITVISTTDIDLDNSTFSNVYTSGGNVINDPSLPYGFTQMPKT